LQVERRLLRHVKGRGGRIAELEDELSAMDDALAVAREEQARIVSLQLEGKRRQQVLAEKKRRLSGVTDALSGAEMDRTLALFDDLHQAREEEMRCRGLLEQIGTRGAAELPEKAVIMRMTEMFFILSPGISSLLTFRPSSVPLFRVLVQKTDRLTGIRAHKRLLFPAVDADMHMRTLDPIPFDLLRINQRAGNSCVIQLPDNVVLLSFTEQFEHSSRQHIACSTHAQIQI
jgi:hypothetical protein